MVGWERTEWDECQPRPLLSPFRDDECKIILMGSGMVINGMPCDESLLNIQRSIRKAPNNGKR